MSEPIHADNISADEIREAQDLAPEQISSECAADALGLPYWDHYEDKRVWPCIERMREARERCAAILNARAKR